MLMHEYVGLCGAFFGSFFSLVLGSYALYRAINMFKSKILDSELSLIRATLLFFINLSAMMFGFHCIYDGNIFGTSIYVLSVVNILTLAMLISLVCLILCVVGFKKYHLRPH
ncbi:MAG: hypothetical protein LBC39_08440 [Methanobrevibacter sp.]|nr:hypothetical protein [Candidatus Methanovirga aequatorialis]